MFSFLKTFNSEFPYIEVWFTDQSSRPLETEDKIYVTLVINESLKYKNDIAIQLNLEGAYL